MMRLTLATRYKSLDGEICEVDLPDFVAVCGLNGSGKTNLLEAINNGSVKVAGLGESNRRWDERVQLVTVGNLEQSGTRQSMNSERSEAFVNLHRAVAHRKDEYAKITEKLPPTADASAARELFVRDSLVADGLATIEAITRMVGEADKNLTDFEAADFARLSPLTSRVQDMFSLKLDELFLRYRDAIEENDFRRYKAEFRNDERFMNSWLDDESFVELYGPPPWTLLNEILAQLNMNFEFLPPPPRDIRDEVPAEASIRRWPIKMRDRTTRETVEPSWLSSGEKTLLSVALCRFSSANIPHIARAPELLLLDEPDVTLHPSMVPDLLHILEEVLCRGAGIRIIMTSHSPTTIALVPEESLFTIVRGRSPRLRRESTDGALTQLTIGLPTLSVRQEHRLVVFVEAEIDEACYTELFQLLRGSLNSPFSLVFISAQKSGTGGQDSVRSLVSALRAAGNLNVRGIIDRDDRTAAPAGIVFSPTRRSLENLILDPLAIGLYLLRQRSVHPRDMSLPEGTQHYRISPVEAQQIVNYVSGIAQSSDDDLTQTSGQYLAGFSVTMPGFWKSMNGHELEGRLRKRLPMLNAAGQKLPKEIVDTVLRDNIDYINLDTAELLKLALAPVL